MASALPAGGSERKLAFTLDQLIARPVTTARRTEEALGVTHRSAQKIIDRLEQDGVLTEITDAPETVFT